MGAVFIGRDRERAELLDGLEAASAGRGGVFLISGEPGIGKTALAEHVAGRAAERGARVLWGRSWEGGAAAPYWMWTQVLRSLLDGLDDETIRSLLASTSPFVTLLVPELGDHLPEAARPTHTPDSEAARFYLFEATARFLKQAASIQPLVLVLDDLLAGDRSSHLLLRFLARDLRSSHLMVVATYRSSDADGSTETVEVLEDLLREGHLLGLGGLDRDEVRDLIAATSGVVPWNDRATAIHEATAGNPLFVREVTRLLASTDLLEGPGPLSVPVPGRVRTVIRRRLAPLSAEALQVLSAAAVVGGGFDLALVSAASDRSRACVLDSLSEAMALGVIAEVAESAGTYRFSHPLMREAIYERLPLATRTQMHHRVAKAIERLRGGESPWHLGELAYHFAHVAALGESAKAREYARRAGERAMDAFAYEEAVIQYHRALAALALAERPDPLVRCDLLVRLGQAQARAGEYRVAKETFLQAAEIARRHDSPELLARAALGMGEQLIEAGRPDGELLALLEEAIAGLNPDDSAVRVRLQARLSLEMTFVDGTAGEARRDALSLEALRSARRLEDRRALVDALRSRWMALWGPDGLAERAALADEILAMAAETGDRATALIGRAQRATCSLQSGEMAAVDVDILEHARLAEELRMPYFEWASATIRTAGALLTGSLDAVEALAQKARDRLPGRSNAEFAYLNQVSTLRWEQGRLGELRDDWARVVPRVPHLGIPRAWLCLATTQAGAHDAAREMLQETAGTFAGASRDGLWMLTLALTALSAAELEDRDTAERLYPLLSPYAGQAVVLPMLHPALCLGSVAFYVALLATGRGAWEEATSHFETALGANKRLGARPFLARTHVEYARMLIRRGDPADRERADHHLGRAAAMAVRMGLAGLSERIETLQEVAGRPDWSFAADGERRDAGRDEDRLRAVPGAGETRADVFRREGDVWTIVHDGSTVRLPDTKGLRCLARLLARPGEEVLALDLERADAEWLGATPPAGADGLKAAELHTRPDMGDAGEVLDAQARAAYKERMHELREELEEAEDFNDPGRAARVREEMDFLARELSRAVGLGGRSRKAASHAERARLNVTRAIRTAMKNIERVHPSLGEHLGLTIRTGRYCSYTPDPRVPVRWES